MPIDTPTARIAVTFGPPKRGVVQEPPTSRVRESRSEH